MHGGEGMHTRGEIISWKVYKHNGELENICHCCKRKHSIINVHVCKNKGTLWTWLFIFYLIMMFFLLKHEFHYVI